MLGLSGSEMLFYGGLGTMAAAVALAAVCAVVLSVSGRKIKRKLEQEYGKPKSEK